MTGGGIVEQVEIVDGVVCPIDPAEAMLCESCQ
jgi:hypothetical protein